MSITFDDGLVHICQLRNVAAKGDKPDERIIYMCTYFFGYQDLGINRYYTALANKEQIECVIAIPYDRTVRVKNIVKMEDETFYKIVMVQHPYDDDGIRYTRLSLERLDDEFDAEVETDPGLIAEYRC